MDGAPACPFVAFGDDRDGRATSPDHRHRCFAESPPAPRALAHQEAYCLSSAFPVCPTFQDWARREAAHARGGGERPETAPTAVPTGGAAGVEGAAAAAGAASGVHDIDADDDPARSATSTPVAPPGPADPDASVGDEPPVRRNPPRDWAAPPPWASGTAAGSRPGTAGAPPDVASEFLAAKAIEGQGLAGSPADRLAGGPPPASAGGSTHGGSSDGSAGAAVVGGAAAAAATSSGASGGWSASADGSPATAPHDELAGLVQGRTPSSTQQPAKPAADGYPPSTLTGRRPSVSSTRPNGDAIPGPSWERMRRYEAYPEIKTRAGIPGLPRIAVLIGALAIAAIALFMLPALLGFGGGGGSASPSPSASGPRPSVTAAPTVQTQPSQQVYIIKQNDTLSKVAKRFGLTLDELLAANKGTITNPNKIAIGDTIIIPVSGSAGSAAPSALPSTSAAP